MMKKLLAIPLLSTALLCGTAVRAQTLEVSEIEAAQLINAERVRLGLNPLQISQKLTQVADWMATDMLNRGFVPLDHVDSLGRNESQRLNAMGYNYGTIPNTTQTSTAKGEILAGGQTTAAQVVQDWIASPSHYAAIQNPRYRVFGVSRVGNYWAVEFGSYVDSLMQADIGPVGYATTTNAANYMDGAAPGMLASLFGVFLNGSTATASATILPLPPTLLTLEVRVDGQQAGLFFVSNNQINFQIPSGVGTGVKMIDVYRAGTLISRGNVIVASHFGALFTAKATGSGAPAGQRTEDGRNYSLLFDDAGNPVPFTPGTDDKPTYLELYGTGLKGVAGQQFEVLLNQPGTNNYYYCEVTYVGPQGNFIGLDQLNVKLTRLHDILVALPGPKNIVMMLNNGFYGNTPTIVIK